jgi:DNA-binding XRE family transcriptional regulator
LDTEFSNRQGAYDPGPTSQKETVHGRDATEGGAVKLGVSARTLSLWECDRIVPAWAFQPRLIAYLGHDSFTGLTPGKPKNNETSCVAFLAQDAPVTTGEKIKQLRLKLRKTRLQLAAAWGISPKTLWGWETDRWQPSALCQKRLAGLEL